MKSEAWTVLCSALVIAAARAITQWDGAEMEIEHIPRKVLEVTAPIRQSTHTGGVERELKQQETQYLFPIAGDDYQQLSSPYGIRISPFSGSLVEHPGLDCYGVWRARIVSVWAGTVIAHWPPPDDYYHGHPILGGMIQIQHVDGSIATYGHMSSTYVHEGDVVEAGQVIGRQGETGQADGEHLHFELVVDGENVNPLLYVQVPGQSTDIYRYGVALLKR